MLGLVPQKSIEKGREIIPKPVKGEFVHKSISSFRDVFLEKELLGDNNTKGYQLTENDFVLDEPDSQCQWQHNLVENKSSIFETYEYLHDYVVDSSLTKCDNKAEVLIVFRHVNYEVFSDFVGLIKSENIFECSQTLYSTWGHLGKRQTYNKLSFSDFKDSLKVRSLPKKSKQVALSEENVEKVQREQNKYQQDVKEVENDKKSTSHQRLEWLKTNQKEYAGKYLAFDKKDMVSIGITYKEAKENAVQKGVSNPFVVHVPDPDVVYHVNW